MLFIEKVKRRLYTLNLLLNLLEELCKRRKYLKTSFENIILFYTDWLFLWKLSWQAKSNFTSYKSILLIAKSIIKLAKIIIKGIK